MDYFLSRFTRNIKHAVSMISGGSCIAIVALSLLGVNTIAIPILAAVAIFPAGLIFFENTKIIRDMEIMVSKLNDEMRGLALQVELLETRNEELKESVQRLQGLLEIANKRVKELTKLAEQYKDNNKKLEESVKKAQDNNQELDQTVSELLDIKEQYQKKILDLRTSLKEATDNLHKIGQIKLEQEEQLGELEDASDVLIGEVDRLDKLVNQSKQVIATLLGAQDLLTDMKSNTDMMKTMIDMFGKDLTDEMFDRLDKDKDGVLTKEEFLSRLMGN